MARFPIVEMSFIKKFFQKNKVTYALEKFENKVGQLLMTENEITLVNEEYEV